MKNVLRTAALAATGTALVLAGTACGYAQSDPEKAVQAMIQALVDGDGEKVCDWTLGSDGKPVEGQERTTCLESVDVFPDEKSRDAAREEYKKMTANGADVETDDDRATLTYTVNDDTKWVVEMKQLEGRWYFVESHS
ncbi:hypothetical protein [Nocardioides yefusunii]|uniref:DUF4878 domain-containing protein n=1 Tax=Nocardioides yefusunii TaxID=2500546 RepID=A0ABW1R438_9ACTN|nr:hypothetical protein [Nocardioides yefusunii]